MQAQILELRLDRLDWEDLTFAVHSFLPQTRLEVSLEHHGIICPPWVCNKGSRKYAIVDGFKRLDWAGRKGLEYVQCVVFPASCSYEELLILRVEGKLFGPPLNPAEKAQIIAQCARTMPREFILERILPALEVAQRSDAIEAWGKMLAAGEALLKATASGEVAERAGIEISNWGDAEMSEILAVLKELRCSASIQMEVIERIREIALIQDRSRLAVLQQPEVQAVLKSRHSNHRQKTEALRMLLSRWRFPRLSARKESFIHQWNEASLPRAIRLSPPPDFEGGRWQLELAFGSQQELKELLELALDFAVSPVMARILSGENS